MNSWAGLQLSFLTGTCGQLQAGADPPGLWGSVGKSIRRGWKPHPPTQLKLICTKTGKSPKLAGGGAAGPPRLHYYLFIIYAPHSPYPSLHAVRTLHVQEGCRSNTGLPGQRGGHSYRIPVRSKVLRALACSWPKNLGPKQVSMLNHLHNWLAESRFITTHFLSAEGVAHL